MWAGAAPGAQVGVLRLGKYGKGKRIGKGNIVTEVSLPIPAPDPSLLQCHHHC